MDIDEIIEILNEDEAVLSGGLNETTEPGMASIADKLLTRDGLSLDHDHQLFNKFLRQLLRAELESVRRARERYNGNLSEPCFDRLFAQVDADTPPTVKPTSGLTLRELIERLEGSPARSTLTETTRDGYGIVFRALSEVLVV